MSPTVEQSSDLIIYLSISTILTIRTTFPLESHSFSKNSLLTRQKRISFISQEKCIYFSLHLDNLIMLKLTTIWTCEWGLLFQWPPKNRFVILISLFVMHNIGQVNYFLCTLAFPHGSQKVCSEADFSHYFLFLCFIFTAQV